MPNQIPEQQFVQRIRGSDFPNLSRLRLSESDIQDLAQQGFVAAEQRQQRTHFKLRFRSGGQQRVRYIGGAEQAKAVQAELDVLQREVQLRRRLARLRRAAALVLRRGKRQLEPLLGARGFYFHGRAPRQRRKT